MPQKPHNQPHRKKLSELERQVMHIIWQNGKTTAKQIKQSLEPEKTLALSTILTILTRLKKKKYIKEVPSLGRSMVFQAIVPKESVARKTLRGVLKNFFSGSPSAMMAHLLKNEKVSPQELDEIRRLLDSKSRNKKD